MNYISIKEIMRRITRHPLLKDVPYDTLIDHAVDFMRILGVPNSFLEKTEIIDIDDYRGQLPCDFYSMIQVRDNRGICFRQSTDSFHLSDGNKEGKGNTYKIQGSVIFTSLMKGKIELAYDAIPVDSEGVPMIPDNSSYIRALELYVKVQEFTGLFDEGKINFKVLENAQQQYAWAVGQSQTDLIIPSIDQMESISNLWNSWVPKDHHRHGYYELGNKERLKRF